MDLFEKDFIKGGIFNHKTNNIFKLFPYTASTSDKGLSSFDSIIGSFVRAIFDLKDSSGIDYEKVINATYNYVSITSEEEKNAFGDIVKRVYFDENGFLNANSLLTFEFSKNSNNENKISSFLVSVFCEQETIANVINECKKRNSNLLDKLIIDALPSLPKNTDKIEYYNINKNIKSLFTEDICFLLKRGTFIQSEITDLLSYYYFHYISQTILCLDKQLYEKDNYKEELYFCLTWEKTSKNRKCYNFGWRKIERLLDSMFTHAVLLDMLNHFCFEKMYCYEDIYQLYSNSDSEIRKQLFDQVLELKQRYENEYIKENVFLNQTIENGDFAALIRAFHESIKHQFLNTVRKRANDAYKKSFTDFSRNNFLQNRKRNGLMLALDEERIILLTKVILKTEKRMKLNDLIKGFELRGVYFDNTSREALILFYDKLGLIEKKSDSGDAKYVKGIL